MHDCQGSKAGSCWVHNHKQIHSISTAHKTYRSTILQTFRSALLNLRVMPMTAPQLTANLFAHSLQESQHSASNYEMATGTPHDDCETYCASGTRVHCFIISSCCCLVMQLRCQPCEAEQMLSSAFAVCKLLCTACLPTAKQPVYQV